MIDTTKMYFEKECVHSVRYNISDKKAPFQTVYLNKAWLAAQAGRPGQNGNTAAKKYPTMIQIQIQT